LFLDRAISSHLINDYINILLPTNKMSSLMMWYYVNRWNNNGIRHVMDAIERHDLDWLKQLADYGATLDHNETHTYVHRIDDANRNNSHMFCLPDPVWIRMLFLEPPIALAVRLNNILIVEYLLSKDINVNSIQANGNTLLYIAVKNRNYDMIQLLLDHKANPNIPNLLGTTPIWDVIADDKHHTLVDMLLAHGATVTYKNFDRQTLLHQMARYSNQYKALPILLENGCKINDVDHHGYTPLYYSLFFWS
jgi:hypothetical protein